MPCALMRSAAWPLTLDTVPLTELHHSLMRTWREETWKGQEEEVTGTLSSNHIAGGGGKHSFNLEGFLSHKTRVSFRPLKGKLSHCNLHFSSVQRRSTSLYNISSDTVACGQRKSRTHTVPYLCCSQRSEPTYPPQSHLHKMTEFSPHLFSVQHSRLYPCHLYFLRHLIN